MIVDLRKTLQKIRGWDELHWDGAAVLVVLHNQQYADSKIAAAIRQCLDGSGALTAVKRSSRTVCVVPCARLDAVRSVLYAHVAIVSREVDDALGSLPSGLLREIAEDSQSGEHIARRAERLLSAREVVVRDRLRADAGEVDADMLS